jgi:hypothetical protein
MATASISDSYGTVVGLSVPQFDNPQINAASRALTFVLKVVRP